MDFIDQMNRENVLYVIYLSPHCGCFSCSRFFWGYFGVGSGTHYMYSLGDDDEIIKIL